MAAGLKQRPSARSVFQGANPGDFNESRLRSVWSDYGLARRRLSLRTPIPQPLQVKARHFRQALEQLGGPFLLFGRYLSGRGDLLPVSHLIELGQLPVGREPGDSARFQLDSRLENLQPERSTPVSGIWTGRFQGRPVVVEILFNGGEIPDKNWKAFCNGIRMVDAEPECEAAGDSVLEGFRYWLQLQADPSRKRKSLERMSGSTVSTCWRFPEIAAELELSEDLGLAYFNIPQDPPKQEDAERKNRRVLASMMEGLIELPFLFSAIPVEFEFDDLHPVAEGVTFRIWPALAAIPPERHHEIVRYVTCLLSEDRSRAAHHLLRMVRTLSPELSSYDLRQELAAGTLDLEAMNRLPASALELLYSWKALRNCGAASPQFLQLFHRYSLLNGFWNGAPPKEDLLPEAVWPVMGRIFSLRVSENLSYEKAGDWLLGSALVLLSAGRQWTANLEELRDNDFAEPAAASRRKIRSGRLRSKILALLFLAFIPLAIQVAWHNAGTPWEVAFSLLGGMALLGLIYVVVRMAR
jgi:hypothetical protein